MQRGKVGHEKVIKAEGEICLGDRLISETT